MRRLFVILVHGVAVLEIGTVLLDMSRYDPSVKIGSGGQEIGLLLDALMLAVLVPSELVFCLPKVPGCGQSLQASSWPRSSSRDTRPWDSGLVPHRGRHLRPGQAAKDQHAQG